MISPQCPPTPVAYCDHSHLGVAGASCSADGAVDLAAPRLSDWVLANHFSLGSCDAGCADVFLPFMADCATVMQGVDYSSVSALCEATRLRGFSCSCESGRAAAGAAGMLGDTT